VCITKDGAVRSAARVKTDPATLELFARSLVDTDEVVIEATANALAIARIIEPHAQRVVLANPKTVRESSRRAKTTGLMPGCWRSCWPSGFWMRSGHRMRRPEHGGG
jgi:transposase